MEQKCALPKEKASGWILLFDSDDSVRTMLQRMLEFLGGRRRQADQPQGACLAEIHYESAHLRS